MMILTNSPMPNPFTADPSDVQLWYQLHPRNQGVDPAFLALAFVAFLAAGAVPEVLGAGEAAVDAAELVELFLNAA